MRMLPGGGGRGYGEGILQYAAIFFGILIVLFFLLLARNEWDRRHGVQVPPLKGPINPQAFRTAVLKHPKQEPQDSRGQNTY